MELPEERADRARYWRERAAFYRKNAEYYELLRADGGGIASLTLCERANAARKTADMCEERAVKLEQP